MLESDMSVAPHPEQPGLPPSKEAQQEQSVGAAMSKAVDDLFTCEAIAAKLAREQADEEVGLFVDAWKQRLVESLEGTCLSAVDTFLNDFDRFQSERRAPTGSIDLAEKGDIAPRIESPTP